jgi:hypothetical protein
MDVRGSLLSPGLRVSPSPCWQFSGSRPSALDARHVVHQPINRPIHFLRPPLDPFASRGAATSYSRGALAPGTCPTNPQSREAATSNPRRPRDQRRNGSMSPLRGLRFPSCSLLPALPRRPLHHRNLLLRQPIAHTPADQSRGPSPQSAARSSSASGKAADGSPQTIQSQPLTTL